MADSEDRGGICKVLVIGNTEYGVGTSGSLNVLC